MYGIFFPNLSSVISEKFVVTPIFFLDSDSRAKIPL